MEKSSRVNFKDFKFVDKSIFVTNVDDKELCLKPCVSGYDIILYNEGGNIIGRENTNLRGNFSPYRALKVAIIQANELINKEF